MQVVCLNLAAFSQQVQNIGQRIAGSDELSLNIEPIQIGTPIFATSEMLTQARKHVREKREPFYTSWTKTLLNANRTINSDPYQKSNHTEFFRSGIHHGGIARDAAIVYVITGDIKYADKSRNIILSWAATNEEKPTRIDARFNEKGIIGSPAGLVIGRVVTSFCYAYSLVYSHLSEEDKIRD